MVGFEHILLTRLFKGINKVNNLFTWQDLNYNCLRYIYHERHTFYAIILIKWNEDEVILKAFYLSIYATSHRIGPLFNANALLSTILNGVINYF